MKRATTTLITIFLAASCSRDHTSETTTQGGEKPSEDVTEFSTTPAAGLFEGKKWTVGSAHLMKNEVGNFTLYLSSTVSFSPCVMATTFSPIQLIEVPVSVVQPSTISYPTPEKANIQFNRTIDGAPANLSAMGRLRIMAVTGSQVEGFIAAKADDNNKINGRFVAKLCSQDLTLR